MSGGEKVLCYNRGCGKEYLETENNEGKLFKRIKYRQNILKDFTLTLPPINIFRLLNL